MIYYSKQKYGNNSAILLNNDARLRNAVLSKDYGRTNEKTTR
jgi:hypothetical protein